MYTDRHWLYEKHYVEGLSIKEMAELAECSAQTIRKYLRLHNLVTLVQDKSSADWPYRSSSLEIPRNAIDRRGTEVGAKGMALYLIIMRWCHQGTDKVREVARDWGLSAAEVDEGLRALDFARLIRYDDGHIRVFLTPTMRDSADETFVSWEPSAPDEGERRPATKKRARKRAKGPKVLEGELYAEWFSRMVWEHALESRYIDQQAFLDFGGKEYHC